MRKIFLRTIKFTTKLICIYIVGFIFALIAFALISKHMKTKQYSNIDKNEIIGFDFSEYIFAGTDTSLIKISDFKGKYVLVDFWFSGCEPCLSAMNSLSELADKNQDEIVILSISIEDLSHMTKFIQEKRDNNDERFIKRPNWKFANIIGHQDILKKLKIRKYPTYFVLDSSCRIVDYPLVMPKLAIKKRINAGATFMDYIEGYHSVMPCGGLKKYLGAYSMVVFLPGLFLFLLVISIVLVVRKIKRSRIKN